MTALATAATSVLLVAGPAAAEDAGQCAPAAAGSVPKSGSVGGVTAPAHTAETQRFVEKLVQVVQPGPAAPVLDESGAKALLGQLACQSGADGHVARTADNEEENCIRYRVGPGWSPNWPMLDALGVRELIERSSGTASVCVGDPSMLPGTTAVQPQPGPQAGSASQALSDDPTPAPAAPGADAQPQPEPQAQPQPEAQNQPEVQQQVQVQPQVQWQGRGQQRAQAQVQPYQYSQVYVQPNGQSLMESLGIGLLLRGMVDDD
ncbi:hypothetical protein [Nonomuraea ferruginea]|uniref:Secreted protein n=1 Tax=Nonomuraea ferruginea TaxID=46174 RepID=A0ABT4T2F6_9ACTN|nr:hypothetical protein [Nonomuraea ferruginea]MDA0643674.1 hypothetical protein [Nonomuraea ferruginea]